MYQPTSPLGATKACAKTRTEIASCYIALVVRQAWRPHPQTSTSMGAIGRIGEVE
jgi:hypothetical protein